MSANEGALIMEIMKLEERCETLKGIVEINKAAHTLKIAKLKEEHSRSIDILSRAHMRMAEKAIDPPVIYSNQAIELAQQMSDEKIKNLRNMSFSKRLKFLIKGEI